MPRFIQQFVHMIFHTCATDVEFAGKPEDSFSWPEVRKIAAHQVTASDLNTFTITFPVNKRMKFVMSGDELISLKETFGLCEGRAEQHCYIPVRAT